MRRMHMGALLHRPSASTDRLLADAVRFSEVPSPTDREESRATWVVERLNALSLTPSIDEHGNILVRIGGYSAPDERPYLIFAFMGTSRWDPVKSYARVELDTARGAGLGDAIGPAALLSLAEALSGDEIRMDRDCILLFLARPANGALGGVFDALLADPNLIPVSAIGLEAFNLGHVSPKGLGTWRLRVRVRCSRGHSAVDSAVSLAQKLGGVRWDATGSTRCHIRRVRAGSGYTKEPLDGVIDLEVESPDPATLEMAKEAVLATAKTIEELPDVRVETEELGFTPVGDGTVNATLLSHVREAMRGLHIPIHEEDHPDPAAWFSARGIPALSIALSAGSEGAEEDIIDIASLETGRRLLLALARSATECMPLSEEVSI